MALLLSPITDRLQLQLVMKSRGSSWLGMAIINTILLDTAISGFKIQILLQTSTLLAAI